MFKKKEIIILSFDYGKKYIGSAIGNTVKFSSAPLLIINNLNNKFFFIEKILNNYKPSLILVGFPSFYKSKIKSYIEIIFLIKKFIKYLINKYNLRLKLIDESYSSAVFKNYSIRFDNISADILLKDYLKFLKNLNNK